MVVDARPLLNARANQALQGLGYENSPQYKQVRGGGNGEEEKTRERGRDMSHVKGRSGRLNERSLCRA